MKSLVLTISNDLVVINNQHRVNIKGTNIPRDYGSFKGDFYWSAEIIRYDEVRKTLHVKVVNYHAPKSEFIGAEDLPYRFSSVLFSSLDHDAIKSCLDSQPKGRGATQQDLFSTGSPFRIEEVRKDMPVEGQSNIRQVKASELAAADGYIVYPFSRNGKREDLRLCRYDGNKQPWPRADIFLRVLGKETVDVIINVNGGILEARSADLEKAIPPLPEPKQSRATKDHFPPLGGSKYTAIAPAPAPVKTWVEHKESITTKICNLEYGVGHVTLGFRCRATGKGLQATILNQAVMPEFKYISRYFSNVIGRQSIVVDIVLRRQQDQYGKIHEIAVQSAHSTDIDKINPSVIAEAQDSYCVDHLFSASEKNALVSIDDLLSEAIKDPEKRSAVSLVDVITEKRADSKHALQLKYLAGKHLAEIQPLKFGKEQTIKTFLFLVQGRDSLFLVLEAIEAKLATYIWSCPKLTGNLAFRIGEIESLVTSIERKKRREYLDTKPEDFFRIRHRYQNEEEDFLDWQEKFLDIIDGNAQVADLD